MRGCSWGGHVWLLRGGVCGCSGGVCVVALGGGMCGCSWGACVVAWGGVWLLPGGACMVAWGDVHGCSGGACMVAPGGGMHGFSDEIQSMSRRYTSYWNALLLSYIFPFGKCAVKDPTLEEGEQKTIFSEKMLQKKAHTQQGVRGPLKGPGSSGVLCCHRHNKYFIFYTSIHH